MTGAGPAPVLGLLRTAGMDVALPLEVLREVVPCPAELATLPVQAAGLLGALSLRGTVLPVVDLATLLSRPAVVDGGQVVVVVASEGRLLGLRVDEVRGLATIAAETLLPVTASGAPLLFSRTFHDQDEHVVSVLDAEALLALPGVPVVGEAPPEPAGAAGRRPSLSLTLVRCGPYVLGLDVAHVHSTVPRPALRPSVVDGPTCLGVTGVEEAEVAVADLLLLLGLGALAGTPLDCGLVVALPAGRVVLGVTSMVGLREVPLDDVVPLPALTAPSPLLTHLVEVDGVGACLIVDGTALLASAEVVALSRVGTELAAHEAEVGLRRGPAHLTYAAGTTLATPLSQVREVLAWPGSLVPCSVGAGVLGAFVHRGVAVPVLSLAVLLERTAPEAGPQSRLLLVEADGSPVAFAVPTLHAIAPLTWTDEAPRGAAGRGRLGDCPLVQLEGMPGLVPVVDLVALARSATVPASGPDWLPGPRSAEEPVRTG